MNNFELWDNFFLDHMNFILETEAKATELAARLEELNRALFNTADANGMMNIGLLPANQKAMFNYTQSYQFRSHMQANTELGNFYDVMNEAFYNGDQYIQAYLTHGPKPKV